MVDASAENVWILWAIVIPLGPVFGFVVQRFWLRIGKIARRCLILLLSASVAISMLTVITPWSMRGTWPQSVNLALGYISATCLLCIALKKRPHSLALYAMRGLLAAVFLAVCGGLWLAYSQYNSGETETKLYGDVVLRRSSGGWAGIDWEGVRLYQRPRWFPVLEKKLLAFRFGDAEGCNKDTVLVVPEYSRHAIRVQCGTTPGSLVEWVDMP